MIGESLLEFCVDYIYQGTGQLILAIFTPDRTRTETVAMLVGLAFWLIAFILLAIMIWGLFFA